MGDSFESLIARAKADPDVVGVVLTGSRSRGMATDYSDTDVLVVVPERGGAWLATTRTLELDTIILTLAELTSCPARGFCGHCSPRAMGFADVLDAWDELGLVRAGSR